MEVNPLSSGKRLDSTHSMETFDTTTIIIRILVIALLIVLTAFFVAAEFSVVKMRMSRIDQLITEGSKTAKVAKRLLENLDYYLSACQLGITVTALGLGWLGESTVGAILGMLFEEIDIPNSVSTIISFVLAFSIVTFLHVVLGELAPKSLAIQKTEAITMLLAPPLYWFGKIMKPFIWTLNGSARIILRLFGVEPAGHEEVHSEEEIKIIMTQSYKSGEINQTELSYMQNIFSFDERIAKDIMLPRTDLITISNDASMEDIIRLVEEYQFTRYPVAEEGDKDKILGFINAKQLFTDHMANKGKALSYYIHNLPIVSEYSPLQDAMLKMQVERTPMALVIDEYGGTAGVITMEDILEEIVGEIRDEFDKDEKADIEQIHERLYRISGRVLIDDLNERFNLGIEEEDIDTIGGWVMAQDTEVSSGQEFRYQEYTIKVMEVDNHQVKSIYLQLPDQEETATEEIG